MTAAFTTEKVLTPVYGGFPHDLKQKPRWIMWRVMEREGESSKLGKVPCDPRTLNPVSMNTRWMRFEVARRILDHLTEASPDEQLGIGFVFARDDIIGIDLDDCRDPETGKLDSWAQEIVDSLDGFTEISCSGTGVHVYVRADVPEWLTKSKRGQVEIFATKGYFAATGRQDGFKRRTDVPHRQEALDALLRQYWPEKFGVKPEATHVTRQEAAPDEWFGDDEVIERARARFGGAFEDLFDDGDIPSGDHSREDFSLLCMLARYSRNHDQLRRIFERSQLLREKWMDRPDYQDMTIDAALEATVDECAFDPVTGEVQPAPAEPTKPKSKLERKLPKFELVTVREMFTEPWQDEWLVDDYIPLYGWAQIFGKWKSMKSFILIDLAAHIALGLPWYGKIPVRQGPVVILAGEGHRGMRKRLEAWAKFHGDGLTDAPIAISKRAAMMDDEDAALEVKAAIDEASTLWGRPPVCVAFDPLFRLMSGDLDTGKDMARFISTVDAALGMDLLKLIVHHPGHSNQERSRGASVLPASLDAEFRVQMGANGVKMSCSLLKDGSTPPDLAWLWREVLVHQYEKDGELRDIKSVALEPVGKEVVRERPPMTAKQARAMAAIDAMSAESAVLSLDDVAARLVEDELYPRMDNAKRALKTLAEKPGLFEIRGDTIHVADPFAAADHRGDS